MPQYPMNREQANALAVRLMHEDTTVVCKVRSNGPKHAYVVHVTHLPGHYGDTIGAPRLAHTVS